MTYLKFNYSQIPQIPMANEWPTKRSKLSVTKKKAAVLYTLVILFCVLLATTTPTSRTARKYVSKIFLSDKLDLHIASNKKYRASDEASNTHFVVIANKANPKLCKSLFSAYVNGYPAPSLPFFGKSFEKGWLDKAETFHEYVQTNVKNTDTVLLMDGYDVVYQLHLKTVLRRLKYLPRVVFGADKLCYPVRPDAPACKNVPQSPLGEDIYGHKEKHPNWERPRWINAGTVFGQGDELKRILDEVVINLRKDYKEGRFGDDQAQYANVVTNATAHYSWSTDTLSQLVQVMIWSEHDLIWEVNPDPLSPSTILTANLNSFRTLDMQDMNFATPKDRQSSIWRDKFLLRNFRSNTIPATLHYAGPWAKNLYNFWWPRLWFMQPEVFRKLDESIRGDSQPGGAGIWVQERWIPWSEICGDYDLRVDN